MFNFTTLTVYNAINTSGANQNLWDSAASKHPSLRIGNTRFDAADISAIEIKAPSAEALASVSFDMSKIIPSTGNTTGRIVLYISLSMNNLDSFYSNDLVYKGKPLFVEFPVSSTDTAADVAARVKNIADKYLLFQTEEKILNVSAASGVVTFEGVNGYQIISKAILQKYDPEAINVDCCSKLGDYVDVITGVPVIYVVSSGEVKTKDSNDKQYYLDADGNETEVGSALVGIFPGLEAFGDYNWIIHNLRLPTLANTHVWAPTKNEMPVVGLNYTQFIITLVKERDGIMGEIVGARGTSVTTHVLYVAGDYHTSGTPAYTVYTKLNALKSSAIATTADTKLANPFGTSKSLVG